MPNASLRILVPEGTTNYITNPTFRNNKNGWSEVSNTNSSRTLLRAHSGIASLMVIAGNPNTPAAVFFRVNDLVGIQDFITVSAYVRGAGKVRIRLIDNPRGSQWSSQPIALTDTRWKRIEVSGRCTGSNDMRVYIESPTGQPVNTIFYVDDVQMERKPYSTTYCDGQQAGCRWNLTANATASTRDPYTRAGGRWVALAGPCRGDDDIYITTVGGMGMPPINNNTQSYALAPGSYFQNSKITPRVLTFGFNVKKRDMRTAFNPSLARLHELRQQLIDIIKPDKGRGDEEFMIEYTDGDFPIYLSVRYEAGLDGSWDIRNQWVNSFPVRFLAVSPMYWEDDYEVASLNFQSSLGIAGSNSKAIGRVNGIWDRLNYSVGNASGGGISSFALGTNQELYAAGTFQFANNNSNAINPFVDARRIARWDGVSWVSVGIGADNIIEDIVVAPNGFIYVTGSFLNIGGVAANRVAFWNPNTSTWNALGTGLNNVGNAIAVAPNGDVYVGGSFTTAGGVTARSIAKWDGTAWYSVGASQGFAGTLAVLEISITKDGQTIYVGGQFTAEFGAPGNTMLHIASYSVATNLFSTMGSGFNQTVNGLVISPTSGIVYAAGDFTLSGTAAMNYISQWNGSAWLPLGNGMNNTIAEIDINSQEEIIAVGTFTLAGGVTVPRVALWNGSTWVNIDSFIAKGTASVLYAAVRFHPNGDIYIGGSTGFNTTETITSAINLITNSGSAEVSPIIYVAGPGKLRWVENQSTGKVMYIDLTILSNEEVMIDFGRAKISSAIRGDLSYTILPGSDFKAFKLMPGENKLAVFMTDDTGGVMQIGYRPSHWSSDSTMRGAEII